MLVKVKPGVYVNTEHVIRIARALPDQEHATSKNEWLLTSLHAGPITLSAVAASYLMEIMEVAEAVILPGEEGYVDYAENLKLKTENFPLTSRVAQLLRDELTQGATSGDIAVALNADINDTIMAIIDLIKERVVTYPGTGEWYYHASHAPREYAPEKELDLTENSKLKTENRPTPNLDPSSAGAPLVSNLGEDNANLITRSSSRLCGLCGYPYSNQTHLNNCVPLGVME